jgi:hypothetical protein
VRVAALRHALDGLHGAGIELEHYDFGDWATDERGVLADGKMKIAWFKDPAGNVLSIIEEAA